MLASHRAQRTLCNRKRRQLRRIERTYRKISVFRLISPREDFARFMAFFVVVVLVGACNLIIDQSASSSFLVSFYAAVLLAGYFSHCLALKWSKRPWTYVSLLDGLLAQYEPVNVSAYRALQQEARRRGSITRVSLWEWLDAEHRALNTLTAQHDPDTSSNTTHFLDKKL